MTKENEQDKVIKSKKEDNQLVTAPPGAGKTYSLIKKVVNLVSDPYNVGAEILVLSFTRSAVKEIKNRIRAETSSNGIYEDTNEIGWVVIQTFDSFVTWALFDAAQDDTELKKKMEEPIPEEESGYDARISILNKYLHKSDIIKDIFSKFHHLIVDEAQDLVGVRADLVSNLCDAISGGKTIFMDESQAIYNYLVSQKKGTTFEEFLTGLKNSHNFELIDLTYDHRTKNTELKSIKEYARQIITAQDLSGEGKFDILSDLINGELDSVDIDHLIAFGKRMKEQKTETNHKLAVLCRNNGEVLQLANHFFKNGVYPEIRRGASFKSYPAWIGRLFSGYEDITITKTEFQRLWEINITDSFWNPSYDHDEAWNLLKETENQKKSPQTLDLRRLKNYMQYYRVPDELLTDRSENLILSTVHRAKGREFNEVYLLPQRSYRKDSNPEDEARILYVGITRPINVLKKLKIFFKTKPRQFRDNRWVLQYFSKKKRQWYYNFQVGLQRDYDSHSIINKHHVFPKSSECQKVQDFLWCNVKKGDPVTISGHFPKPYTPIYSIFYSKSSFSGNASSQSELKIKLGQLTLEFVNNLREYKKSLKGKDTPQGMPKLIYNVVVDKVVTEVSTVSNTEMYHTPYTMSGFWLGIRLQGLGFLYFKY